MRNRLLFILLFLLISAIANGSAVDGNNGRKQLKWPNRSIKIYVSSSLFDSTGTIKSDSDIRGALVRSLNQWEEAGEIDFEIALTEVTSISPAGVEGDGISVITVAPEPENINAFSNKTQHSPGLTRVFFDQRGFITEADIALNPSQLFTTDNTPGTFDLEAVLSHEIGHLLGLSHTADASAVMFEGVARNGFFEALVGDRGLSSDDRSKVRKLYGSSDGLTGTRSIKARLNSSQPAGGRFQIWIQDVRNGTLLAVETGEANLPVEFGYLRSGNYEIIAQQSSQSDLVGPAVSSVSKEVLAHASVVLPSAAKPVPFDLRYIGLNGVLGRRGLRTQAGNRYQVTLAGPGLNLPDLRFEATSPGIQMESIGAATSTLENNMYARTFRLSISATVARGEYSIFVQNAAGSRRYMVGAVAIY